MGGTIARLARADHEVFVYTIVNDRHVALGRDLELESPDYRGMQREELADAHALLRVKKSFFLDLSAEDVHGKIASVMEETDPTIVFVPHGFSCLLGSPDLMESDLLALSSEHAPRLKAVFAYDPVYDPDDPVYRTELFASAGRVTPVPNFWFDVTETIHLKLAAVKSCVSQKEYLPYPRSPEALLSLSKSCEDAASADHAESFVLLRGMM